MITIEQCRAARGLLDWTQQDLANASGLSKTAINNFEKKNSDIKNESLHAIRMAFESADLEFIGREGLRKKSEDVQILKGENAIAIILDDAYNSLKGSNEELLISNIDDTITQTLSHEKLTEYAERFSKENINKRILCPTDKMSIFATSENCRILPKESVTSAITTFIYGEKIAFELWDHAMIIWTKSAKASKAERIRFEKLWAAAAPLSSSLKKMA